jgi:hypothetical protein
MMPKSKARFDVLAERGLVPLCLLAFLAMLGRLLLVGSAVAVRPDTTTVVIDLGTGQEKVQGRFNLVNTGKDDGVVRLKSTCNCTILSDDLRTVPPFSSVPVDFTVSGIPSKRQKQIGHIQVIDGTNNAVLSQVEIRMFTADRTLVCDPKEVDLRFGEERSFAVDVYLVSLEPGLLSCATNTPGLDLRFVPVRERHWRLEGSMGSASSQEESYVQILDRSGVELERIPVRLPTLRVGNVRVGWGPEVDRQTETFWALVDPYYGPSDPLGTTAAEHEGDVVRGVEDETIWLQLPYGDEHPEQVSVHLAGEELRLRPPLQLEDVWRRP